MALPHVCDGETSIGRAGAPKSLGLSTGLSFREALALGFSVNKASIEKTQAPPPPKDDIYQEIRKLAELRDEGLITSEEFEAKKRDLLERL